MNTKSSYYNIFLIMITILMFTTGSFQNTNASKVDTNKGRLSRFCILITI